jgi:hypothetical protein
MKNYIPLKLVLLEAGIEPTRHNSISAGRLLNGVNIITVSMGYKDPQTGKWTVISHLHLDNKATAIRKLAELDVEHALPPKPQTLDVVIDDAVTVFEPLIKKFGELKKENLNLKEEIKTLREQLGENSQLKNEIDILRRRLAEATASARRALVIHGD